MERLKLIRRALDAGFRAGDVVDRSPTELAQLLSQTLGPPTSTPLNDGPPDNAIELILDRIRNDAVRTCL